MDKQRQMKEKKEVQSTVLRRREKPTGDVNDRRICVDEANLAAIAISLNVRLRLADMPATMQERAMRFTRSLFDCVSINDRPSSSYLAHALKKEFDTCYGPAWHCVVGKSFGSFVTHSPGGFVYFSIDSLSFLLFKTEVHLVNEPPNL